VLLASLVGTMSCGASARHLAVGDSTSRTPSPRGRQGAPLYVIPPDSLRTLSEGTPVEIVLQRGAKVLGTSFQPQPDPPAEFHVREAPRRMFQAPDTVRIPIAEIEVAVSSVPLSSGSPRYAGPRKLGPLPRPGEGFEGHVRPA